MRHLIILLFSTTLYINGLFAQDCKPYVPTKEGAKWEITNYDHKDKVTGRTAYELIKKEVSDDDVTFTIKVDTYDKKDELVYTNEFTAACKKGEFKFDMAFMMDGAAMQSYQNMEVDVDATDLEIPAMDAATGTTLKDGSLE